MYIPSHYKEDDRKEALSFMQEYHFGTLISTAHGRPLATHLPFCIKEIGEDIVIRSHVARSNDHWQQFGGEDLVVFAEPHAYISPRYYDKRQNVPTWNYLAVHAYGAARILESIEDRVELLKEMIAEFEPQYLSQWDTLNEKYRMGMLNGIVAFELRVTDLQFKEKLSQNKKEGERQRIVEAFIRSSDPHEKSIGLWMAGNE